MKGEEREFKTCNHSPFMVAQQLSTLPENFGKTFKTCSPAEKKIVLCCNRQPPFALDLICFAAA